MKTKPLHGDLEPEVVARLNRVEMDLGFIRGDLKLCGDSTGLC